MTMVGLTSRKRYSREGSLHFEEFSKQILVQELGIFFLGCFGGCKGLDEGNGSWGGYERVEHEGKRRDRSWEIFSTTAHRSLFLSILLSWHLKFKLRLIIRIVQNSYEALRQSSIFDSPFRSPQIQVGLHKWELFFILCLKYCDLGEWIPPCLMEFEEKSDRLRRGGWRMEEGRGRGRGENEFASDR